MIHMSSIKVKKKEYFMSGRVTNEIYIEKWHKYYIYDEKWILNNGSVTDVCIYDAMHDYNVWHTYDDVV